MGRFRQPKLGLTVWCTEHRGELVRCCSTLGPTVSSVGLSSPPEVQDLNQWRRGTHVPRMCARVLASVRVFMIALVYTRIALFCCFAQRVTPHIDSLTQPPALCLRAGARQCEEKPGESLWTPLGLRRGGGGPQEL